MIRKGVFAVAIIAVATTLAWAQTPPTQPSTTRPDTDRIAALIAQMGVQNFHTREQAQRALAAIGPAAEPALRDAAAHSASAEIRWRARAAADQIENDLPGAPTHVTLIETATPAGMAWWRLSAQAGIPIVTGFQTLPDGSRGGPPVTLNLTRAPFLVALEQLCRASDGFPQFEIDDVTTGLEPDNGFRGVWDQEDRMAAVATTIVHERAVDLTDNRTVRTDMMVVDYFFDPRLAVVNYRPPRVTAACDEAGLPVHSTRPRLEGFSGNPYARSCGFEIHFEMACPPNVGKTIARFEGQVPIRVATATETLTIPDLTAAAGGPGVAAGGRIVKVISFANQRTLHLRISQSDIAAIYPGDDRPIDLAQEFASAQIRDETGMVIPLTPTRIIGKGQLDWQATIPPATPGQLWPPFSLHWKIVTKAKDMVIPFRFRNLPLPPD